MASWAQKIRAHGASKQRAARKPKPEVQTTWAQTRFADSEAGDPGAVIDVHFIVEENTVTLTDEKGKPIGGKASSYVLQPGETALQIAKRMALANWRKSDAPFNRALKYQSLGIA
ncbi:hypothetical protein [Bradyrhizobium icense]|uniref:Uncharacterized protein n=1 Tax=Bradyrhizobium icense TaxID=1274631 RepID=A0A1B1UHN3_9BRAD|nr:hypothetical protein [Bradyrhizobium icense]ANW02246.1 hypothetical protein LMTR13_20815 [Bradyrhizobium icense]